MLFGNLKSQNIEKRKNELNVYLKELLNAQTDLMISDELIELFLQFFGYQ